MAQPQNNISIVAPGFMGLNTQDSPLDMDEKFASVADNCVIDQYGRVAARRGFQAFTQNPEVLNGNPIVQIKEFVDVDGTSYLFACGNNAIYLQEQVTPFGLVAMNIAVAPTANNWQIIPWNGKCYFVQANHEPLVFDPATSLTDLAPIDALPPNAGPTGWGYPNCATAAFGRLWISDFDNDKSVVAWSALLEGEDWVNSGAGALETEVYWPNGFDEVTSIAGHNDFLVVFGKRNILLYTVGPSGPLGTDFALTDTIEGIGCIARDSIEASGMDMYFVDATGVRTLNRTIQEKSIPIGDISINVRSDFKKALVQEPDDDIKAVYHPEDSFYCVFLPRNPKTYVFDTRGYLQNGSSRTTQWVNIVPRCGARLVNRVTYFGGTGGLYTYKGFEDIALDTDDANAPVVSPIQMQYDTHPMDFGSPSTLLFPKQVDMTLIGGLNAKVCLNWFYDYKNYDASGFCKTIDSGLSAYWNTDAKWGEASFFTKGEEITQLFYNIWGSGRNIKLSITTEVEGSEFSIQELNIQALQGRIL